MILKAQSYGAWSGDLLRVRIRCPECGHFGTFDSAAIPDVNVNGSHRVGVRICPNPSCRIVLLIMADISGPTETFPFQRIDFDSTNIPAPILKVLQEAIDCHAHGAYVAAAMMVRKTLEVLCAEQGVKGKDLKDKLAALKGKLLIPTELLDGMDELRLFGNDAAHIEARLYDDIGKEEVDIAVEITKEILKAVYQYSSLLSRLRSLKKTPTK